MSTAAPLDRRRRRRLETIEEVLDTAVEIMAEEGVAGLSLGEVARRMGIRPPSLYVYFPSKSALYDALFARGARSVLATMQQQVGPAVAAGATLEQVLLDAGEAFVRWAVDNQAYSQLLFWRPVPGWAPTPEAYAPAVQLIELSTEWWQQLQARGLVRPDAVVADALRDWTVLTAGVVSQQLSNAPHESYDAGRFTAALPALVAMFAAHYGRAA
jgi:AcrR family transcriptional regulator